MPTSKQPADIESEHNWYGILEKRLLVDTNESDRKVTVSLSNAFLWCKIFLRWCLNFLHYGVDVKWYSACR